MPDSTVFYSTEGPSQLGNTDTSVAHNSLLLTVRVRRKAFLTNPIDCCQRCLLDSNLRCDRFQLRFFPVPLGRY
jgi:hypothetical protein